MNLVRRSGNKANQFINCHKQSERAGRVEMSSDENVDSLLGSRARRRAAIGHVPADIGPRWRNKRLSGRLSEHSDQHWAANGAAGSEWS